MEFNVTFDLGAPRADGAALLAAIPGDATRVDAGTLLWRSVEGERHALLQPVELQALALLGEFRARAAHAARLAQAFRCTGAQAAALLEALRAKGVLVEPGYFLAGARGASPAPAPPRPLIAIRTRDRPQGLQRLLESALADEQRYGTARDYLIVDDTVDAASAARTGSIAASVAARTRSRLRVLGPAQRVACLAELLRGVPAADHDALRALLDPAHPSARTGARGWNWAVLAAAGGTLSFVDDDTVFPLRRPPAADARIDPRDSIRATTRYYDDTGYTALDLLAEDPFDLLGEWLGQDAATLLGRHGWRTDQLDGTPASDLQHLRRPGRVLTAFTGVYGGLAFDSAIYLNRGRADSLADLWRAPYRHQRLEADAIWHGVEAPRLLSYAVYTPTLLDARELLPFAGTWGRADDTYFLGLLNACAADPLHVFAPALMGHFPLESRHRLEHSLQPLLLDTGGLLAHYFDQIGTGLRSTDRTARLAAVGAFCADLAVSDARALGETIVRWRQQLIGSAIDGVSEALHAHPEAPAEWREYAGRVIAVNREALLDESVGADAIASARTAFDQAAFGCRVWPRLWQRCAEEHPLEGLLDRAG